MKVIKTGLLCKNDRKSYKSIVPNKELFPTEKYQYFSYFAIKTYVAGTH